MYLNNFAPDGRMLAAKQQQSGVKLLQGHRLTASTNPRYGAGAATNPDPEVFQLGAATQVVTGT